MDLRRRPGRASPSRWTVRMRLAVAYGAMFLLAGTALLALSYLLVARFPLGATLHLASAHGHVTSPGRLKTPPPSVAATAVSGNTARDAAVTAVLHAQRAADLRSLLLWFAVALGVMAVASGVLGWFIAGRVLRPLRRITATARRISEANLHERLALQGPSDEITDLAGTFDGLLARLEGAFEAQRAFVANASHELRTPLAMMRTSLDVAAAKCPPVSTDAAVLSAKVREGLDQADRLVESFLVLARAERGPIDEPEALSLCQLAADALRDRHQRAADAGVTLHSRLDEAEAIGSPMLLARLAGNLIDNAIRYNQPGGWVRVATGTASTSTGEAVARLSVENSGPVLDPGDVAQLGRPFRRVGTERTASDGGLGLGLSIVEAVAGAHHGTVELEARPEGGMRVTVTLPRAAVVAAGPVAS